MSNSLNMTMDAVLNEVLDLSKLVDETREHVSCAEVCETASDLQANLDNALAAANEPPTPPFYHKAIR